MRVRIDETVGGFDRVNYLEFRSHSELGSEGKGRYEQARKNLTIMKTIPFLLLAYLSPLSSGDESLDYDASVTFVQERSEEKIPKEKAIFCLGPEQVEEVYMNHGKEEKKIARLARSFDFETAKTAGRLLLQANLSGNVSYEVCIYRCDKKELLVRITGFVHELHNSQFPLKNGDLVVIQRVVKEE